MDLRDPGVLRALPGYRLEYTAMDPNLDPRALAQQNSYLDAIRQRLGMGGGAPTGLLGGGMAQGAAQAMQMDPYRKHVQEAQAMGQPPMTYEQFMQMQQQPRQGLLQR